MAPRGINRPGYSSPRTPTGINRPGYSSPRAPMGINRPGYSSPKTPTNVNRPGTSSPSFSGYSKPSNRPTSPGSGYTPGGDSFQNYSQKDQATMFNQAGGKDKFIDMAIATQAKYPRGLDYQKFLDRSKRYQTGQILGGQEVMGPDGIMRLQMAGADTPMRDAQGRQILSMQAPNLTAQAPTLRELMGDVGRGASSMLGGAAKIPGQMLEAYQQVSPLGFVLNQIKSAYGAGKDVTQGIGNFFKGESQYQPDQAPGSIPTQQEIQSDPTRGMTPGQINLFYNLTGTGMDPNMARQQVLMRYANGGIATLN